MIMLLLVIKIILSAKVETFNLLINLVASPLHGIGNFREEYHLPQPVVIQLYITVSSGNYDVRLITIWSDKVDTLTITKYVHVYSNPTPQINGTSPVCNGTSATLDAGNGYAGYLWSTGATTQTLKDSIAGAVSVTVFDNNGCKASKTFTLVVNPILTSSIKISPQKTTSICPGQDMSFIATAVNGGTSPTFTWYLNGEIKKYGSSSTFTTPALIESAQVYCMVTSNASCIAQQTASSSSVMVNVTPIATPTITISQSTCLGSTVVFNSSITHGGDTPIFLWTVNGVPIGNYSDSTFTLNNAKNGNKVQCTLTSNAACVTEDKVTSLPINIDCVLNQVNNIDGLEGFAIMPNPNKGDFIIKMRLTADKNISFNLINNSGQIVFTLPAGRLLGDQTIQIHISKTQLQSGLYLLKTVVGTESFISKVEIVR